MATAINDSRRGISSAAPVTRRPRKDETVSLRAFNIVCALVLIVFALLWLLPSLWALYTSLNQNSVASLGAGPPAAAPELHHALLCFAVPAGQHPELVPRKFRHHPSSRLP